MGMVTVQVAGSFGKSNGSKSFSAMKHGHAAAVAEAISFLSTELLPEAIALDHQLHTAGDKPSESFGK